MKTKVEGRESKVESQNGKAAVLDAPLQLPALPTLDNQAVTHIHVSNVVASPFQPRKEFPADEMESLRESIRANGIRIPLLGRPRPKGKPGEIELVAGERRFRCTSELKLPTVPMIVQALSDDEVIRIQRLENGARENLKALEAAEDYVLLEKQGKSVDEICTLYGVKRSHVFTRKRVAKLPEEIKKLIREGKLAITLADLAAKRPTPEMQSQAAKRFTKTNWNGEALSFREAANIFEREYQKNLSGAPWKHDDATLVKSCGACTTCPKRSGNIQGFEGSPHICTDVKCYDGKQTAHAMRAMSEAKAAGGRVISAEQYDRNKYDFKSTSDTCHSDSKGRSWGTLAKVAAITPAVAVNRDGEVVKVFTPEDKEKILKANKLSARMFTRSRSAVDRTAERKRLAKEKQYRGAAMAATPKILEELVTTRTMANVPGELWPLLARAVYDALDITVHDYVAKRRGLSKSVNESRAALDKWFKQEHSTKDYVAITLEFLLCADWNGGGWRETKWDKDFKAMAKLAGVKLDKLLTATPAAKAKTGKAKK